MITICFKVSRQFNNTGIGIVQQGTCACLVPCQSQAVINPCKARIPWLFPCQFKNVWNLEISQVFFANWGENLVLKKMFNFLSFLVFLYVSGHFKQKKIQNFFPTDKKFWPIIKSCSLFANT